MTSHDPPCFINPCSQNISTQLNETISIMCFWGSDTAKQTCIWFRTTYLWSPNKNRKHQIPCGLWCSHWYEPPPPPPPRSDIFCIYGFAFCLQSERSLCLLNPFDILKSYLTANINFLVWKRAAWEINKISFCDPLKKKVIQFDKLSL